MGICESKGKGFLRVRIRQRHVSPNPSPRPLTQKSGALWLTLTIEYKAPHPPPQPSHIFLRRPLSNTATEEKCRCIIFPPKPCQHCHRRTVLPKHAETCVDPAPPPLQRVATATEEKPPPAPQSYLPAISLSQSFPSHRSGRETLLRDYCRLRDLL